MIKLFNLTVNNIVNSIGVVVYDLVLIVFGVVLLNKFGAKRVLELT